MMMTNEHKGILKVPYPIPFYTHGVDFTDDSLQGFNSIQEAEHWQDRGCGIASVRMVIDGFQMHRGLSLCDSYGRLLYKGLEQGAYCDRGWIHKGLVKLAKKYDIRGKTFRQCSVDDILLEIEKNRPCIASVTVGFNGGKRNGKGEVIPAGGHLIVVIGVLKVNGVLEGFYVNHPSSIAEWNLEDQLVNIEEFRNSFSGAFMSFWISKKKLRIWRE